MLRAATELKNPFRPREAIFTIPWESAPDLGHHQRPPAGLDHEAVGDPLGAHVPGEAGEARCVRGVGRPGIAALPGHDVRLGTQRSGNVRGTGHGAGCSARRGWINAEALRRQATPDASSSRRGRGTCKNVTALKKPPIILCHPHSRGQSARAARCDADLAMRGTRIWPRARGRAGRRIRCSQKRQRQGDEHS